MLSPHAHGRTSPASPHAQVRTLPLHVHELLAHAARVHPRSSVTTLSNDGDAYCWSYTELADRARQRMYRLLDAGLGPGDRVASHGSSSGQQMAWLYGALSAGITTYLLNPQQGEDSLLQQIDTAQPDAIVHDPALTLPAALARPGHPPHLRMDEAPRACREHEPDFFPEDTPSHVCYSSGTTGAPKTIQYTHRSTVLHAWACALPDAMALRSDDRVMPLVQMYQASAWGAPFACPLVGASLVLVPPSRDPAQWYDWIEQQQVTVLGAVSAHWLRLLPYMRAHGLRFSTLQRTVVAGSRLPSAVAAQIADGLGIEVRHAWGMTETSPLASVETYSGSERLQHGKPVFGIELGLESGTPDRYAHASSQLQVRGHWVAHSTDRGWLDTGDLARFDDDGRLDVIDRLDEAIAHPGLVISCCEVEFHACGVSGVRETALLATSKHGPPGTVLAWIGTSDADTDTVEDALRQQLPTRFDGWTPDRFIRVDSFPVTASAKVRKQLLKEQLGIDTAAVAATSPPPASRKP